MDSGATENTIGLKEQLAGSEALKLSFEASAKLRLCKYIWSLSPGKTLAYVLYVIGEIGQRKVKQRVGLLIELNRGYCGVDTVVGKSRTRK